jgi:hypothetical protein
MAVGDRCVYIYVCRVAVAGKGVEMRGWEVCVPRQGCVYIHTLSGACRILSSDVYCL